MTELLPAWVFEVTVAVVERPLKVRILRHVAGDPGAIPVATACHGSCAGFPICRQPVLRTLCLFVPDAEARLCPEGVFTVQDFRNVPCVCAGL
jgi:hypothetical protein